MLFGRVSPYKEKISWKKALSNGTKYIFYPFYSSSIEGGCRSATFAREGGGGEEERGGGAK